MAEEVETEIEVDAIEIELQGAIDEMAEIAIVEEVIEIEPQETMIEVIEVHVNHVSQNL